ncbi:unnamed protein product [Euphydryas editha]|uniref:Uncharacterized protein n=1 Tax=Euphydryas editha TaxID=104508 RepID=A0AAU9UUQ8_EUPED|nr:unnamed protein product [Euphydryas editha]
MNPTSVFSHSHNTNKFDLIEICRVCLSRDINMDYLFDDKNNKIIDKIEFCTGIQLKEEKGLPNQICKNCFNKLSIAHKFKSMCLLSEQRLHQIILKRINLETADEKRNIVTNNDYCIQNVDDLDRNEYQGQYIKGEVEVEFVNPDDSFPQEELKDSNVHSEIRRSKEEKLNIIIEVHKEEVQSKPENTKLREQGPYKNCEPQQNKKFNRLKCGPCNIQFSTKRESDNHKKEVHSENLCWICEVCGKKFLNPSSYYTHVRSHLPDRLECAHCDYRCVTKSDMEKHLRVHSGIKKFKCTQCSAGFHTTSNLNDHVRRCHSSAEKRFACELCPKRFHERSKLNRHLDTHNDCKR